MPPLYSTKVVAKGGRHGSIRSEDGLLDLSLAMPKVLGGNGGATKPNSCSLKVTLLALRTLCCE
jgi:lipoyl-dependent peroxiredoxin